MVRRLCLIAAWLIGGLLAGPAYADSFTLANGETITGELLMGSESDAGIQIKVGEGKYERVPWANFSQEDLKKLAKVQKLTPLVEPFIEITQADKIKKTEVNIKQPNRLALPPKQSLVGALFSSGLGLLIMLLLYAANIYAGYEISIFRARPTALVCGISAALPLIGPIIFLSMPTKLVPVEETWTPAPEAAPEGAAAEAVNPMQAAGVEHPTGLRLAATEASDEIKLGQFQGGEQKPPYRRPLFTSGASSLSTAASSRRSSPASSAWFAATRTGTWCWLSSHHVGSMSDNGSAASPRTISICRCSAGTFLRKS
jgi:hypothetical protein